MPSVTGTGGAGSGLPIPGEFGVLGDCDNGGPGVAARALNGSGLDAESNSGYAGNFTSESGAVGVSATVLVNGSVAVLGEAVADPSGSAGVVGHGDTGVYGDSTTGDGVQGFSYAPLGEDPHGFPLGVGLFGYSAQGVSVWGESQSGGLFQVGVVARSLVNNGMAFYAIGTSFFNGPVSISGNVNISGSLSKSGGGFRIDHPLDPENKYLSHSFVESPDMLNIYNGVIQLDDQGAAIVEFQEWFDELNHEFRYQLTSIGSPAPNLHVASEIANRSFRIGGGTPKGKVSWQVTGIRKDKWANANRIKIEEDKPADDRGYYLHPELYGQPEDKKVIFGRRPQLIQPAGTAPARTAPARTRRKRPVPRSRRP